jgi:hypothetical protein
MKRGLAEKRKQKDDNRDGQSGWNSGTKTFSGPEM